MEVKMKYTEAKEKIEALLSEAAAKLEALGITVSCETELIENHISETESEPLMILGSVALTMDGLTEDDTYYVSVEARIDDGEVSDEAIASAEPKFRTRIDEAYERLEAAEDRKAELVNMGLEVDAELERLYEEELARSERAMKRDLMIAAIGTGVLVAAVIIAIIISKLF